MDHDEPNAASDPALYAVAQDFVRNEGIDLLARWSDHLDFWDRRLSHGLDPYTRTNVERVGPEGVALNWGRESLGGVNFACQDYLSLSSHPAICAAAIEAIERWGVHSAGSIALQGGSMPLLHLEERLGAWLGYREVRVFPTGWAAGYGVVRTLARENDHLVIDALAHACLQEGAVNATRNIHRTPNCSHEAVARRLASIRSKEPHAGILVITESLFSMDSTVPDLRVLQETCRAWHATLLVDVAHDLGALGDGGLGFLGDQGVLGEIDVVMGSFSKTFASNGGFVASNARGIRQALNVAANPLLFSNALSPVQAQVALAALDIVRSPEGAQRRRRLMDNVQRLRLGLQARDFVVLGHPSAIVPTVLGDTGIARRMTCAALNGGALVNLIEHPAVSRRNSRWRLQVMADHSPSQIDRLIDIAVAARERAAGEQ